MRFLRSLGGGTFGRVLFLLLSPLCLGVYCFAPVDEAKPLCRNGSSSTTTAVVLSTFVAVCGSLCYGCAVSSTNDYNYFSYMYHHQLYKI